MSDPIIRIAQLELQRVEQLVSEAHQQLAALAKRKEQLEGFLATYDMLAAKAKTLPASPKTSEAAAAEPARQTAKAMILDAVEQILRRGQPKNTPQLVEELAKLGVPIGGTDKVANLSALVSREKQRFRNERGLGYFLVESSKDEAADARTPAASELWPDPSNAHGVGTATAAD